MNRDDAFVHEILRRATHDWVPAMEVLGITADPRRPREHAQTFDRVMRRIVVDGLAVIGYLSGDGFRPFGVSDMSHVLQQTIDDVLTSPDAFSAWGLPQWLDVTEEGAALLAACPADEWRAPWWHVGPQEAGEPAIRFPLRPARTTEPLRVPDGT